MLNVDYVEFLFRFDVDIYYYYIIYYALSPSISFVHLCSCSRTALHTDAEDEDMDADDQQNALNKVIEIMTQGECGSLQAAMSQRGFNIIMEQSAIIVEARAKVQKHTQQVHQG